MAGDTTDMRQNRQVGTERGAPGFSLPELLTVIALMALFILFGGPAVSEAYRAYKVRAAADGLVTDIRALRYNAVANRAPATMTINNQTNALPNQYSFVNSKGVSVTVRFETGVNIETTSASTLTFGINGGTGVAGNTSLVLSCMVNGSRSDRYTLTVTPTGTVSSAYATF